MVRGGRTRRALSGVGAHLRDLLTVPLSIQPADLDGLHQVTVTVEHAKTHRAIYELETLLFEAPDSAPADEPRNSPASRRKRGPE